MLQDNNYIDCISMSMSDTQKEVSLGHVAHVLEVLEQQEQELMPVEAKMRQLGQTLQSFRDKKCDRVGQLRRCKEREVFLRTKLQEAPGPTCARRIAGHCAKGGRG